MQKLPREGLLEIEWAKEYPGLQQLTTVIMLLPWILVIAAFVLSTLGVANLSLLPLVR